MKLIEHYGLSANPFDRSAPPEAVFRHQGFAEALARLTFTVDLGLIALLLSEPGCGKSLLLGVLADELARLGRVVHYFAYASAGPFGLVNVLARKIGIAPSRSRAETAYHIAAHLAQDERLHVVVVDEAHEVPDDTLEDLRLLSITDFDRKSPFLLLLAGQPRLDDRLAEPVHYALDQRITTVARLLPLSLDETREYLVKRLAYAGLGKRPLFEDGATEALFDASGGVPRRINNIATSALIVAASKGRRIISAQDIADARIDRGRP
jgi:type II secretory pathway predicted ATPase ExeA